MSLLGLELPNGEARWLLPPVGVGKTLGGCECIDPAACVRKLGDVGFRQFPRVWKLVEPTG